MSTGTVCGGKYKEKLKPRKKPSGLFGKHLFKIKGYPKRRMQRPHAHHILFKGGRGKAQKALVKVGQKILLKHGIDPLWGKENLTWAPNIKGQHTIEVLREVVDELEALDDAGCGYEEIAQVLDYHGDLAANRGNTND